MCQSANDARTLRLQVIEELRRVVGFDAYAWLLTDPATAVGVSPLADVPWLPELPEQIRLKYLTRVNRWTLLSSPVALLRQATGGDLAQSLVWRDLLAGYGVGDAASVVLEDRFGCWAFLELWRTGAGPFSRADAAFLAGLAGPLTQALRRCQQGTFVVRPANRQPRAGPVVLLLSPDLQVHGQTPESMEYLRLLVPPAENRQPVPAAAYNVAAQLLAREAGVDSNPPTARVHVSDGLWMTARAARIDGAGTPPERDIAVTIEESSAAERVDVFSRAFAFTARERELLDYLAAGNDTRAVAQSMFLSQNTVQDHLKSIFAKTASRSRRSLLARALGA
jgi:DNA-binding CsgD family transcriptional regulator